MAMSATLLQQNHPGDEQASSETFIRQHYPVQWHFCMAFVWLVLVPLIAVIIFNNFRNASEAMIILGNNSQLMATVNTVSPLYENGNLQFYTTTLNIGGDKNAEIIQIEIPKKIFDNHYQHATQIPLIRLNHNDFALKSYYQRQAALLLNWPITLAGFIVIMLLIYGGANLLSRFIYIKINN